MNSSLEKALNETWKNKEKFYEDTKDLSVMEIIEKIEGKKFKTKEPDKRNTIKKIFV